MMIIILSYGKVASTSLRNLLESHFPGEVFYSHGLTATTVGYTRDFLAQSKTDTSGFAQIFESQPILDRLDKARRDNEPITIITGTREPVLRSLSVAVQTLDSMFDDCIAPDDVQTAARLRDRIVAYWSSPDMGPDLVSRMRQWAIRTPLQWLADEIEKPFGFDLLSQPFDFERGYSILENGNIRLLLYRQEQAPASVEQGLKQLFPGWEFALPKLNLSSEKATGGVYKYLREIVRLPRPILEEIYANPYVRHFLAPEEITNLTDHWSPPSNAKEGTSNICPPIVKISVLIALHNHREWIGQQIESLVTQWRSDAELVIVDDGSTDGGLEVARKHLAALPDFPVTFVRNDRPQGMAVLSQMLRYVHGEIIIQADSDDLSLPGRLDAIVGCFEHDVRCRLVTSNAIRISHDGLALGAVNVEDADTIFDDPRIPAAQPGSRTWLGATSAYHRTLFDAFPPLDTELCPYGLDLLLAFRAALLGTHHYLCTPLVAWRQHARNSHRLEGALDRNNAGAERHGAYILMALAQKLRDAEYRQSKVPFLPLLNDTVTICRTTFFAHFMEWSRLRSHLRNSGQEIECCNELPALFAPGMPPVSTLSLGQRYGFGQSGTLGDVAADWEGFWATEQSWIWTKRVAVIVFRVSRTEPATLTLSLNGLPYLRSQRVCLSIDFEVPHEFQVGTGEVIQVSVPVRRGPHGSNTLTLVITAPDAAIPAQILAGGGDGRLLGVALHWIELDESDPSHIKKNQTPR